MPSIQWRQSARAQTLLLAVVFTFTLALALPATSPAHEGHTHGPASFDGRIPGQPDFERIRGVTMRFNPRTREYILDRPGQPPMRAHVDIGSYESTLLEGIAARGAEYPLPSFEANPACATSGHRIVFVRPHSSNSRYVPGADDPQIRSIARRMNWKFMQQAALSSNGQRVLQMRVDCDRTGMINVHDVEIPLNYIGPGVDTTDGKVDFNDQMNYIYNTLGAPTGSQAVKYLIMPATMPDILYRGLGFLYVDTDKSNSDIYNGEGASSPSNNLNRVLTSSALVGSLKDAELEVATHELLHTMGGTLPTAPYRNSSYHCVDGIDILCYGESSDAYGPYTETRCPASAGYGTPLGAPIDCEFDTYFDAQSEPGEWLDQFWNEGGSENPFLVEEVPEEGVESSDDDVNGDGRSDLITVDSEGTPRIYRGTATGIEADQPGVWLREQVDPALFDGSGHYVVDTADVTGEGRADLITLDSSGKVYVHAGWFYGEYSAAREEILQGAFAPTKEALSGLTPVMSGGDFEPIAVADVTGDGLGDLVGIDYAASRINTFPGQSNGTFGEKVATTDFYGNSPLFDGQGRYALVADATGDGHADLVTMWVSGTSEVLSVSTGQTSGEFVGLPDMPAEWNLDDGRGEEPIGLGDVNADGRADLLTLDGTTLKLRAGISNPRAGSVFASPTTAYTGSIDS
ncbi:MAG TPA: VCBS repeat-containing protein, partial [Solirubrobacterales bacterium]|nr:VCBS repeat-containing protein [Solirubrobacterales bacterium]